MSIKWTPDLIWITPLLPTNLPFLFQDPVLDPTLHLGVVQILKLFPFFFKKQALLFRVVFNSQQN